MTNNYNFCFWDARSKHDAILICINESLVTTILLIAALRIPTFLRLTYQPIPIDLKKILIIHILVIAWAITQSIVNYYSISVYLSITHELTPTDMIEYSYAYTILNAFPGSLVQTLFVTICYTFCRNMVREMDIKIFPKYAIKFVQIIKFYYMIRLIPWVLIVILQCVASYDNIGMLLRADTIYVIGDSAIINVFILASIYIFIMRLKHANYNRLKLEYWIMFCCSICRITVDTIFLGLFLLKEAEEGPCLSDSQVSLAYTILYNGIQCYLMHIIPVGIILKIYNFDYREMMQEGGLIPRAQQENSNSITYQTTRR